LFLRAYAQVKRLLISR